MPDSDASEEFERRERQAAKDLPMLAGRMCQLSERLRSHGMFLDGSQVGDLLEFHRAVMACHDAAELGSESSGVLFLAEALGQSTDQVKTLLIQAEDYLGVRRLNGYSEWIALEMRDELDEDDYDATVASRIEELVEAQRQVLLGHREGPALPADVDSTMRFFDKLVALEDGDMPRTMEQSYQALKSFGDAEGDSEDPGDAAVEVVRQWLSDCWRSFTDIMFGESEYLRGLGMEGMLRGWPEQFEDAVRRSIVKNLRK